MIVNDSSPEVVHTSSCDACVSISENGIMKSYKHSTSMNFSRWTRVAACLVALELLGIMKDEAWELHFFSWCLSSSLQSQSQDFHNFRGLCYFNSLSLSITMRFCSAAFNLDRAATFSFTCTHRFWAETSNHKTILDYGAMMWSNGKRYHWLSGEFWANSKWMIIFHDSW